MHRTVTPRGRPTQTVGSPCTSTSLGSVPASGGSGSRPLRWAQAQNTAVEELSTPDQTPIARTVIDSEAMPAPIMDSSMVDHVIDSSAENTRPRNSSDTWRSNCEKFSTEDT